MFKISNKVRRLTNEEKERYLKDGYLTGLPVFDVEAKDDLNDLFVSLSSRLSSDIDINQTNMWHKASLKFYNLCSCLLYTSPSPRDGLLSRMPSSA